MAFSKLPTDYVDDSYTTRLYKVEKTSDDEALISDATVYTTKGTKYASDDINARQKLINNLIDTVESTASKLSPYYAGTKAFDVVSHAESVDSSTTATNTDHATTCDLATESDSAEKVANEFVLCTKQALTFIDKECKITDSRISADDLADVYFSADTVKVAIKSVPSVETYDGYLIVTVGRVPSSTLMASIKIREVN